jgi:hypothetical protein
MTKENRSLHRASVSFAFFLVLSGTPLLAQNFLRGDADCDGAVTAVDGYVILQVLFGGVPAPCDCMAAFDVDCDGNPTASDSVYLFSYLLLGGPAPCGPFPACGPGPGVGPTCPGYPACPLFKRGDANQDGCVSQADATFILAYLNLGGPTPLCLEAADADDDDVISTNDAVWILSYCGSGGPATPAPGPLICGADPTPGNLTCGSYPASACAVGCTNQIPSDCNNDGNLDISDGICILGFLFTGVPSSLPCGDGTGAHPSNLRLTDANGDGILDVSDGPYVLNFLFNGGPPPVLGTSCVYIEDCPPNPGCKSCIP